MWGWSSSGSGPAGEHARHSPVSGGMSASVTISPSSTGVSTRGSGRGFSAGSKVRSRPSVVVLVGVSSSCSISSCFTISSASTAWPGESEPVVAGGWGRLSLTVWWNQKKKKKKITRKAAISLVNGKCFSLQQVWLVSDSSEESQFCPTALAQKLCTLNFSSTLWVCSVVSVCLVQTKKMYLVLVHLWFKLPF